MSEAMTKRVSRNGRQFEAEFHRRKKRHICAVKCCVSCTLNSNLKRTNHLTLYGDCNEPCTGTRDAAAAWEREWTRTLNSIGFEYGCEQPSVATLREIGSSMVVHGDDFIILGDSEALSEVERAMRDQYTIKVRAVLGAERDDAKEVRPESIRALELQWWTELD